MNDSREYRVNCDERRGKTASAQMLQTPVPVVVVVSAEGLTKFIKSIYFEQEYMRFSTFLTNKSN